MRDYTKSLICYGYTPISSDPVISGKTRIDCVTREGYKVRVCYEKLRQGEKPIIVGIRNPHSMHNIKLWTKLNTKYECVERCSYDQRTRLDFICPDHGPFTQRWHHFQSGHQCQACGNGRSASKYAATNAERHKEKWLGTSALLYIIKCSRDQEVFYKIGITVQPTVYIRFSDWDKMPYNYEIVHVIKWNLYNLSYLERALHELHKEYKYEPMKQFGGYTECFTEIIGVK